MARLLVTGGAGFIGSHIVAAALAAGHHVRVLDDLSTGSLANLAPWRDQIELLVGDVADPALAARAVAGMDWVSHQAARISVAESLAQPARYARVNTLGTVVLLEAARAAGVRRFVFASTAAVYGDPPTLPVSEATPPHPRSPYGAAKLAAELFCATIAADLPVVALRYFNVYGPRQDPHSPYAAVICAFIDRLLRGQPPVVYGTGEQTRDFISVQDVAQANLLALAAETRGFTVLNIATGQARSVLELVATLNTLCQTQLGPQFAPPRPGDILHSVAAVEAAAEQIGFRARADWLTTLAETVQWYRTRGSGAPPARD
jgi:UDP-glucose 4-epimerase